MPRISVVTAFLNEQDSLPAFRERVQQVLSETPGDYEVVLVDDHSTDGSSQIAREWASSQPGVTYVRLSRNCGSHAAFTAGLHVCTGDCAVLLAADLQDPPETIPDLLRQWEAGNDVVWAVRAQRQGQSWTNKLFAGAFYGLMRRIALPEMPSTGADFLLIDRKVIDAFRAIPEKNTNFLALILWMGFRQTSIEYVKQARHAGESKWTLKKKLKLLIDSVVSFSYAPIRWMGWLGLLMLLAGIAYGVLVAVGNALDWFDVRGDTAWLMTILLVGQGAILCMLGMLGEYLWRTLDEARGRPTYIIEQQLSHDAAGEDKSSTS